MRYFGQGTPPSQEQVGASMYAMCALRSRARWRFLALFLLASVLAYWAVHRSTADEPHVLRVLIQGEIKDMNQVRDAAKVLEQGSVKAVLVVANSPGGAPAVSEAWSSLFMRLRAKGIPVVAMVEDVCASGCYLAISGVDRIYSHHSSLVGSVGALIVAPNMSEILKQWGVVVDVVRSGPLKAEPHWLAPRYAMTQALMQDLVDQTGAWFLETVATRRSIQDPESLERIRSGALFLAKQALTLRLVDQLGDEWDALAHLRSLMKDPDLPIESLVFDERSWWKSLRDLAAVSAESLLRWL